MSEPIEENFTNDDVIELSRFYGDTSSWPTWIKYPEVLYRNTYPDTVVFRPGDEPIVANSGETCPIGPNIFILNSIVEDNESSFLNGSFTLTISSSPSGVNGEWAWESYFRGFVDYTINAESSNSPLWRLTRSNGKAVLKASVKQGIDLPDFTWEHDGEWDCFGSNALIQLSGPSESSESSGSSGSSESYGSSESSESYGSSESENIFPRIYTYVYPLQYDEFTISKILNDRRLSLSRILSSTFIPPIEDVSESYSSSVDQNMPSDFI